MASYLNLEDIPILKAKVDEKTTDLSKPGKGSHSCKFTNATRRRRKIKRLRGLKRIKILAMCTRSRR